MRLFPTDEFEQQSYNESDFKNLKTIINENMKPEYFIITKNGDYIIKPRIMNIVSDMVTRRLKLNNVCVGDAYPMRHSAAFIAGTKWREKGSIWGKFDPGGTIRLLLRPAR
jgi:hypothetical protein